MAHAYHRKKQPDLVRRRLLECAARLAQEQGLAAVTVQAVCEAAGVTKGGMFHHFVSKQALIDGVVADLLAKFEADIDARMLKDPLPCGRFTRAYVTATLDDLMLGQGSQWVALYISTLTEPTLRRVTALWFAQCMERHRATDDDPTLEIVRLAADGVWPAAILRGDGGVMPDLPALRRRLIAMTLPS